MDGTPMVEVVSNFNTLRWSLFEYSEYLSVNAAEIGYRWHRRLARQNVSQLNWLRLVPIATANNCAVICAVIIIRT